MDWLKRITYMAVAALLVTVVVLGAATFAQDDGDAETPDAGSGEPAGEETTDDEESVVPGRWRDGRLGGEDAYLAEALGISTEELESAYEGARIAAIEQAVEEDILTEEQAEALLERADGFHGRFHGFCFAGLDGEALLAEALNISVEELQAARAEALAAKLDAMVEAGHLTQEQADLIAARQAVNAYFDREALAEMVQEAYEAAVAEALAEGAISQEQADQLLEATPRLNGFRAFDGGFPGGSPRGHHRFRGGPGGGLFDGSGGIPAIEVPAGA